MTEREMYLKMAQWFRAHGFHPAGQRPTGSGCFATAVPSARGSFGIGRLAFDVLDLPDLQRGTLERAGWGAGRTDDAVAACLIAADLATP